VRREWEGLRWGGDGKGGEGRRGEGKGKAVPLNVRDALTPLEGRGKGERGGEERERAGSESGPGMRKSRVGKPSWNGYGARSNLASSGEPPCFTKPL